VASALLLAERGPELLQLAHEFPEPKAIRDPVRRREVQLQRLKLAMQVAKQAGDTVKTGCAVWRSPPVADQARNQRAERAGVRD
jgi:hypothetical protein